MRFRPTLLTSTALALALGHLPAFAQPTIARQVNTYGLPGGVDTPTAEAFAEGTLGGSINYSEYGQRNTLLFQVSPGLTAALRYTRMDGVDQRLGYLWDRSFDVHYQIVGEQGWRPAVAVGLRDFMGTGVYSAEYLVATKSVTDNIRVTAGVGWGRLAGAWRETEYGDEGGRPNYDQWFTGPARPFASVAWQATDRLSVVGEYSHDDYELEVGEGKPEPGRFNLAVNYQIGETYGVSAYTIGGEVFGAQINFALNARQSPFPSGLEPAPAPVRPRPAQGADPEGWSGAWSADPTAQPAIQTALAGALENEGQELQAMVLGPTHAEVRVQNNRYMPQAQAVGRTARLMTRALPPSVETFTITSMERGLATSSVTLRRSDVERLENTASANIAQAAAITDAAPRPAGLVPTHGLYPRFRWSVGPYTRFGMFDPERPINYEIGAEASARYHITPGLVLSGAIRQRAFGNMDQDGPGRLTPEEYLEQGDDLGPMGVPRVRSDWRMYTGNRSPHIPHLTLAYYAQPTEAVYTRITAGLLEPMYGGISAEALWKPATSRLGLGAEVSHVRKRDFDMLFSFRDYETTTGHVSAYYDFGNGFWGQIDAGRYLAGDVGATVTVNREFENGWRVGAYATKTDMSREAFGEGSFDKGIIISAPMSWATGQPSRRTVGGTLRSLNRDGGVRLDVDGRLYETVRRNHAGELYDGWGRFWR
ncbi:MAG: YjbH domain-containing protein [Paracoccus sp. (in: a-proteobacteria)]|nr:YjbH domain-containing protein [Paracoccus sp. (in: a-proteobacteria)]